MQTMHIFPASFTAAGRRFLLFRVHFSGVFRDFCIKFFANFAAIFPFLLYVRGADDPGAEKSEKFFEKAIDNFVRLWYNSIAG